MASIDKRPDGKWRARWREYPGGPQRTKHFGRKVDAEQFLVKQQHDLLTGAYVAPEASRTTVGEYYAAWFTRMAPTWRPATAGAVANSFRVHLLPVLGGRPLSAVRRADVEALCVALPLAPSTVAVVAQHLGQLYGSAIEDGLVVRNPVTRARLPRKVERRAQPVPLEVAEAIRQQLPDWLQVAVPLGVGVGLRQGEVSGLTVDRVQFLRRTLLVDRQLVDRHVPEPTLAPPKTSSSVRTIPLATFVVDALGEHLARFPAEPTELLLRTPAGTPVDSNKFGHQWRRACRAAGAPGLRFHDLRHTFASALLSRGVSIKAVADWLGHASPTVTLTTYAHLMPADEDVARAVLDEVLAPAAEDRLRTGAGPSAL